MKDAEQINTAIPMVVRRENYADRLTRWMEDERRRERDALSGKLAEAASNSFAEAVSNALMALALAKESKYRWIPVTERLPEEGERCVVLGDGGPRDDLYATCAVWRRSRRGHSEPSWHIHHFNLHGYFDGAVVLREAVTHWMPLPPLPK